MNERLDQLVGALRAELQEYGGLLHLFEEQQVLIVGRNPAGFLSTDVAGERVPPGKGACG